MRFAVLFPGQGAQSPGMGRALYEAYSEVRDVFETGRRATGRDVEALCFDTPPELLARTENAQLALFAVSMGVWGVLAARGCRPAAAAGFSLGELSALCAARVFSLCDGFRLVDARSRAMQRAAELTGGGMSVVTGLPAETVERLAAELKNRAAPVNFNTSAQVTLAGPLEALGALEEACRTAGARRVLRMNLSGAFHTEAMAGAGEALCAAAQGLAFSSPAFPVYTNPTAAPLPDGADIPDHLRWQIVSPVRWQISVETMAAQEAELFVETGSGGVLSGMMRQISGTPRCVRTDTPEALEEALGLLGA